MVNYYIILLNKGDQYYSSSRFVKAVVFCRKHPITPVFKSLILIVSAIFFVALFFFFFSSASSSEGKNIRAKEAVERVLTAGMRI